MKPRDGTKAAAKKAAASLSIAMGDTAIILGLAAAATVHTPPVAVMFTVMAAAAAWMANRYAEQAADPPRTDFDQVARAQVRARPSWVGPLAAGYEAASLQLQITSSLGALVKSFERYDGARASGAPENFAQIQLEAIRHNGAVVAKLQDEYRMIIPELNLMWHEQKQQLHLAHVENITISQVREMYKQLAAPGLALLLGELGFYPVEAESMRPSGSHPIEVRDFVPRVPDMLFDERLYELLSSLSGIFRDLVTSSDDASSQESSEPIR